MSFIFTPVATDNFQRPNENPLNPVEWSTWAPHPALQIISHQAVSASGTLGDFGAEYYTGDPTPNDQYVKITVGSMGSTIDDNMVIGLRAASDGSSYMACYCLNNGDGTVTLLLMDEPGENLENSVIVPLPNPGDVLTAGVVGTSFFYLVNGVQVLALNDSFANATGETGFGVSEGAAASTNSVSLFEMGSVISTPSSPQGNSPMGNVIFTLDTYGNIIPELQTGTLA